MSGLFSSTVERPGWYRIHAAGRRRRMVSGQIRTLVDLWADNLEYAKDLAAGAYIDIMVGTTPDPVQVSIDGFTVGSYGARGWESVYEACPDCGGGNERPCECSAARALIARIEGGQT